MVFVMLDGSFFFAVIWPLWGVLWMLYGPMGRFLMLYGPMGSLFRCCMALFKRCKKPLGRLLSTPDSVVGVAVGIVVMRGIPATNPEGGMAAGNEFPHFNRRVEEQKPRLRHRLVDALVIYSVSELFSASVNPA